MIIHDARVLKEDWVPRELHHREGQIQHFSSEPKPITHGLGGEDVLVSGSSGTGKTTIAKYVVEQLTQQVLRIRYGYTNCISDSTKAAVCHSLVQDAGRGNDLRPEGTPASVYFDRLREMDDHFIAILDEVDVIEDDTIIHALHDLPNVTLILVAVSEDDLFTDLDSRVVSRLRGSAKVTLDKYSHAELCDILWGWIDAALRAGVVDADDESPVIVDGEEQWEFDVDDEHARPRTEMIVPVWMEGLLQQIGIRGLGICPTEGK